MMIVLMLFTEMIFSQLYDPNSFSLGSNIVVNSMFESPIVPQANIWNFYGGGISGWSCTSGCELINITNYCNSFSLSCNVYGSQGIELDCFNAISQTISISITGTYLLHLEWLQSFNIAIGRIFGIDINSTNIAN